MKKTILIAAALMSLAGCSSFPGAGAKKADEHAAHHPASTEAKADTAKFDEQMKLMHDMHQKIKAAKTPAERAALMKDHMSAMQGGMSMMGQMRSGMPGRDGGMSSMPAGPIRHKGMERRMEMMEMMMQMMMDREAAKPPAAR
jgi:outer membrane murein-binding lipoprotein Lpp